MRKLYEIDQAIEECILNGTDFETGEFKGWDELNQLEMERDAKIEGVAVSVKDDIAEIEKALKEINRLTEYKNKLQKSVDGKLWWLSDTLKGEKFCTVKVECTFRKSKSVDVDKDFCDYAYGIGRYEFLNRKETVTADKTKIKAFLEAGGELEHCKLVEKNNLTVR